MKKSGEAMTIKITKRTATWITFGLVCVMGFAIKIGTYRPAEQSRGIAELKCEGLVYTTEYHYLQLEGIVVDDHQDGRAQHKARVQACVAMTPVAKDGMSIPELAVARAYPNSCIGHAQRARDAAQNLAHNQTFATSSEQLDGVYTTELSGCKL